MGTDSFIVYIKKEDIYVDIKKNVETTFDTSNYKLDHSQKNILKNIAFMKDELNEKTMIDFATLKPKMCSYLRYDN